MNKSFAAYTPRSRPLNYDALIGKSGCEAESGNDYFGLQAPEQFCSGPHDPADPNFNQLPIVSYSQGPNAEEGDPTKPFVTDWAVWVATAGVRYGQTSAVVPPANTTGAPLDFYATTRPVSLTHAFNDEGLIAVAIQKSTEVIELKQHIDPVGGTLTVTWPGHSPALYNTGLTTNTDGAEAPLVCYYLKQEKPRTLFARFSADNYTAEYVIVPDLRQPLASLVSATSHGAKSVIYARDTLGRDVTLTSPAHAVTASHKVTLALAPPVGAVYATTVDAGVVALDRCRLDIKPPTGQVFSPLIGPAVTPPAEEMSLSVALVGGEVL